MNYVELCIKIQAIRRAFEATRSPIIPALGVGAKVYTHQVANVLRVLTDVRIRHLLADEVGLGKTVQALMILNALRWQRPDLKALVIVPDRLVPQWRDEIMVRGHTAPYDDGDRVEGEQYIKLLWENKLRSADGSPKLTREELDASKFNVLVVDELHRLPASMQDPIVKASSEFEHLLILTATPAFQDPKRHAQIFENLEPEKTTLARREISQSERGLSEELSQSADISAWPDWAQEELITRMHAKERDIAEKSDDEREIELAALSHCVYRRVIRSRRRHYPGVLPQRRHIPGVVSPMEQEAERQRLMWEYFPHLGDLTREFDPVLLAKRVILSPPSLEQRVDFLRRKGHERAGILEQVKPLVSKRHGDSRLDALIDILNNIWLRDPKERVIVAAQDNLTVDYLAELLPARLPLIGPLRSRGELKIALIRQGQNEEMLEDLAGYGNQTATNLEAFQRGEAQVLLAPESGQVGLNLQRARVLILYSVPWSPAEVEQWIGRLDRIGNEAAFGSRGEARDIDIYTIAQEGLVDQKVIEVLKQFRVFEQTVNLDGEHIKALERSIEKAGLEGSRDWKELEREAYNSFHKDEGQELESPLRPHLPWGIQHAKETRAYLEALPPCPPIISKKSSGPHGWDSAFGDMLKLLKSVRQYIIHSKADTASSSSFNTLWYTFGDFGYPRPVASKVTFTIGPNPHNNLHEDRHPRNCFAYISKREKLQTPPLRRVTHSIQQEEVSTYLRFLSFGDQLHDELIYGWSERIGEANPAVNVTLPQDHRFWEQGGQPGLHTVQLFGLDAGDLVSGGRQERLEDAVVEVASTADLLRSRIEVEIRPFAAQLRCAIESDVRWLRSQLTSELLIISYRRDEAGVWHRLTAETSSALLNPLNGRGHSAGSSANLTDTERSQRDQQFQKAREGLTKIAGEAWSHKMLEFKKALALRLEVIKSEAGDALNVAKAVIASKERALTEARERGSKAQVTRASNQLAEARERYEMTLALWEQRALWLEELCETPLKLEPRELSASTIKVTMGQQ